MTELPLEFHAAFDLDRPRVPTIPTRELAALRLRLLKEEMKEVDDDFQVLLRMLDREGTPQDQIVAVMQGIIKELCDLKYVTEGAMVAFGVGDDPYHEVHRSNMSKLGADGKPVYREDGKVLKGLNYTEADPDRMFPSIIIDIPEEDITECPKP